MSTAAVAGKAKDGNIQYRLYDNTLAEGEHTYRFKAVDEGDNETISDTVLVKLDVTNPEAVSYTHPTLPTKSLV